MIKRRGPAFKGLHRNESGIAAVEFGLILPLMLMIYLGLVELSRGMRTAQRLDLVAHTLADLTAQILPADKGSCKSSGPACINETDVADIFSAANTLMGLSATSTALKMTISEINISSPSAGTWQAKTNWTVTRNGATPRPCNPALSPSNAAPVSVATIPSSYVQATNGVNPTTGPVIVADVIYNYSPGVHFEFFKWGSPPTWTMQRTSYAPVRNTYVPSHIQYFMTTGTNCNSTP
ncbi:TadE/TadG family type IV pilus assembly protein [Methylocystis sp. S23]|jgi:Flp pilus assembly protein TadG